MLEPKLDREKLKAVIHFICARCPVETLGNVKLHKILYFSDMLHFSHTGRALTGVEYTKQPFGPVARHLSWAVSVLEKEGVLRINSRSYFGFTKKDYVSLRSPSPSALSNEEAHLISEVIDFVSAKSAREISELSHNVAWETAELGEVIPYVSVFGFQPDEITEADLRYAEREAKRLEAEPHVWHRVG
jgi:uncharacterized phage-associated protein